MFQSRERDSDFCKLSDFGECMVHAEFQSRERDSDFCKLGDWRGNESLISVSVPRTGFRFLQDQALAVLALALLLGFSPANGIQIFARK